MVVDETDYVALLDSVAVKLGVTNGIGNRAADDLRNRALHRLFIFGNRSIL
ncbi:hypothetical protein SDC9_160225 [bioreactor metagenome]|uniref:Uncharacterized protein n=1 Tax=bioreactor metagenome TaxID=1076179 RepID=A0A645FET3_9ZZZZ